MAEKNISVVMISANFYPHVGGAERQALSLSGALKKRGVGARALTQSVKGLKKSEVLHGVLVERLWRWGPEPLNAISFMISLSLKLLLEFPSYDVIHAHLASSPALVAALWGRILNKPVFIKLGAAGAFGEMEMSSKTILGKLKLLAFMILKPSFIALTLEQENEARKYLGPARIQRLPNGVDTHKYRPSASKEDIRRKLGWPAGLLFLYTGRFTPQKHLPFFVDAFASAVKKSRTPAFLILIGEGIEEGIIGKTAAQAGIANKLLIYPPMKRLSHAYAAADVFVLPSLAEGLSNSLLEAMSSGLAVLASRAGGNSEVVAEGSTGFLFDPLNLEEIEIQTAKFLSRPDLAKNMGRAARKRAEEFYSLDMIAGRYETIYRLAL